MRRVVRRIGAAGLLAGALTVSVIIATDGTAADGARVESARAPSPSPAKSPGDTTERDRHSGAGEVGIGRSTGAVKSSGDESGTAAGMPGKAPGSD